jgi:hypothetical protein
MPHIIPVDLLISWDFTSALVVAMIATGIVSGLVKLYPTLDRVNTDGKPKPWPSPIPAQHDDRR